MLVYAEYDHCRSRIYIPISLNVCFNAIPLYSVFACWSSISKMVSLLGIIFCLCLWQVTQTILYLIFCDCLTRHLCGIRCCNSIPPRLFNWRINRSTCNFNFNTNEFINAFEIFWQLIVHCKILLCSTLRGNRNERQKKSKKLRWNVVN